MKNIIRINLIAFISFFVLQSCDKVEQPVKPKIDIDTTLFTDGNWADYPSPVFEENTNINLNILLEDYTGHKCPNCPAAAIVAKDIEDANFDRVFVASIHSGSGGSYSPNAFQKLNSDCGQSSNPNGEFCHEFRTPEGEEYGTTFQNFGFTGNPYGNINRHEFDGTIFQYHNSWVANTDELLVANNLKVNIQAKNNFYSAANGGYLHIETQFLDDLLGNYNLVTYVIQNELIEWQDSVGTYSEHYHHHNIFLGCVDELAWGQNLGENPKLGDKIESVYSYELPSGLTKDDIHFLTYVYNVGTYEIQQVIKHNF